MDLGCARQSWIPVQASALAAPLLTMIRAECSHTLSPHIVLIDHLYLVASLCCRCHLRAAHYFACQFVVPLNTGLHLYNCTTVRRTPT